MRTEERTYLDEPSQRYLFARCMAPYVHITRSGLCDGLRVLDAGCGSGAGSALMTRFASQVHAVDFSKEDILLTRRTCGEVQAVAADVCQLPYRDESFDMVVSSHVLEHLLSPLRYLSEIKRVLIPGGLLWLVTPNRLFSSPHGPPANPFHVKEYFFDELNQLVRETFSETEFLGVSHGDGGVVRQTERQRTLLHSVDRLGARKILPGVLKRLLRRLMGTPYPSELRRVDADDFHIGAIDPAQAVDLVAACRVTLTTG